MNAIQQKLRGREVLEGAGVKINRLIGTPELDHIDPFVLLDEFKSQDPSDYLAGFPTHPHRGIETITYMIKGSFRHQDSKGNGGLLNDGSVQWMTAGRGILHSEMPERSKGLMWGYQLWLSLPAKDKMVDPQYQHISPDMIPHFTDRGVEVKVISGEYMDLYGPASNYVKTHYFDVRLSKSSKFQFILDRDMKRFIYVHTGSVRIQSPGNPEMVHEKELVVLNPIGSIEIYGASNHAGFLFLAGYANDEPIVKGGPFVMNSKEEIRQAFQDYQNGILDK